MPYDKRKAPSMGVIMSNPGLSRQMREAWYAKPGSTKRSQARSTMRSINKIGQRRFKQDGMGGPGDLYNPATTTYGTDTSTSTPLGVTNAFANPQQTGTTQPRYGTPRVNTTAPLFDRMHPGGTEGSNRWGSRIIEEFPEAAGDWIRYGPQKAIKDIFKTAFAKSPLGKAAGIPEEERNKSWKQSISFVKNIDNVFKVFDGIGEIGVDDMARFFLGRGAEDEEKRTMANQTSGQVRATFQGMADRLKENEAKGEYEFSDGPSTGAAGEFDEARGEVTGMINDIINDVTMTRSEYLASLDPSKRAAAEKMLEYLDAGFTQEMAVTAIMEDLETLKKMFPGVPVKDLPVGAFADEAIKNIREAFEQQEQLKAKRDKLSALKSNHYGLEDNMIDYIKTQDTYLSTIDKLMDRTLDTKYSGRQLSEIEQIQTDTYLNFLTKMKGNQQGRYIDWLDRSSRNYEAAYNRASDRFEETLNWIDYQVAKEEPVTRAKYDMYRGYMNGMYDQLALMSTNSRISSAAMIEKINNSTQIIQSIVDFGGIAASYASESVADKALDRFGIDKDKMSAALSGSVSGDGFSAIDQAGWSTDVDKIRDLYGTTDKDGVTTVSNYSLYDVMNAAMSKEIKTSAAKSSWEGAAGKDIYNKAFASYSKETLEKYQAAMRDLYKSEGFEQDAAKQAAFNAMNDLVYKQYFNGVAAKLGEDPDQVDAIVKYIRRLTGFDFNDVIINGEVSEKAKSRARDGGIIGFTYDIDEDLEDMIWEYFVRSIAPPASIVGADVEVNAIPVKDVFTFRDKDLDTAKLLLSHLLIAFRDGHVLAAAHAPYNAPVVTEELSKTDAWDAESEQRKAEALDGTLLGELTK